MSTASKNAYQKGPIFDFAQSLDFERGNGLGPYTQESTQRYVAGTRYLMWDGRIFKYGKAVSALYSYHGCGASKAAKMSWEAVAAAQSRGDTEVLITETGLTADELQGGYIMLHQATDRVQWRGIAGNEASGASTTKVYLDFPLDTAITVAGTNVEVFYNPYLYATHTAEEYTSVIGVPAVNVTSAYFFWMQTWGPAYISPGESIDSPAAGARNLVFGANYALFKNVTKASGQNAGFYLNQGSASIAGPMIMLQISV